MLVLSRCQTIIGFGQHSGGPTVPNVGKHFVYEEKIRYTQSIIAQNAGNLAEIPFYTRTITLSNPIDILTIDYEIPFVGNDSGNWANSRILLRVNGQYVCDASKANQKEWILHPIHLKAVLANLQPGPIVVQIFAAVQFGRLNIPHYNPALLEGNTTDTLKMFGSLRVLGIAK